jgi:hypothetical protein
VRTNICAFVTLALVLGCTRTTHQVPKETVERAHGIRLPGDVYNCQNIRTGGLVDRGVLSLFELNQSEVGPFLAQLKIRSRQPPVRSGSGDPCINGWNVWPTNSNTFVPGSTELMGLKRTWTEDAKPIEMLSCDSSRGDWLHVEVWAVGTHALIKLYTDWN